MSNSVTEAEAPNIEPAVQEEEAIQWDSLTALDRCDLCGSQAYVGVVFKTGDLLFCAHHFREFEAKMSLTAEQVFDERWKLSDKRLDVSA